MLSLKEGVVMRKHANNDHGFLIAFIINLMFHAEWLLGAGVLFVINYFVEARFVFWLAIACLVIWVLWTLIITSTLSCVVKLGNSPTKEINNKNPYSSKTDDILPKI